MEFKDFDVSGFPRVEPFGEGLQRSPKTEETQSEKLAGWKGWRTHTKVWRTHTPTIFRVPMVLRDVDPRAYTPQLVSLGPYHHGRPCLESMEIIKRHYLDNFLSRNHQVKYVDYIRAVGTSEVRAKMAYAEELNMNTYELAEMMVLDSCFVLELLMSTMASAPNHKHPIEAREIYDPIKNTQWALYLVGFDMLMLENQLPFFLLEDLLKLASPTNVTSLTKLASDFFNKLCPNSLKMPSDDFSSFHHLLHLFQYCSIPPKKKSEQTARSSLPASDTIFTRLTPGAAELRESGVVFKRKKTAESSFLDMAFSNGVLEMSQLCLLDYTNCLLRNLIAFEQCYPDAGSYVTAYAVVMRSFINRADNAALLQKSVVILNVVGSDEDVAVLFHKLCKGVFLDFENSYLSDLVREVNKHCDSVINKWLAKFKHDYYNAAVVLLILTIMQTIFAFLSYVKPPH